MLKHIIRAPLSLIPRPPQLSLSRWNRRRRILLVQPAAGSSATSHPEISPNSALKWLGFARLCATSALSQASPAPPRLVRWAAPQNLLPHRSSPTGKQASACCCCLSLPESFQIHITVLRPPFRFIVDSLSAPRLCATPAALGLVLVCDDAVPTQFTDMREQP